MLHHLSVQCCLARKRDHDATDKNRQHDDRDAVTELERDEVKKVQQPEQRLGEPGKPTECFDLAKAVGIKKSLLLGACEDFKGVRVSFSRFQFNGFHHLEGAVDQLLQSYVFRQFHSAVQKGRKAVDFKRLLFRRIWNQ